MCDSKDTKIVLSLRSPFLKHLYSSWP